MRAEVQQTVAALHRQHYRALTAPLIRILGGFEAAEDVVQEAFAAALQAWHRDGLPDTPLAWLHRTARNRAIDRYRRSVRWQARAEVLAAEAADRFEHVFDGDTIHDDALRLIFTCCHPSLSPQAQIGLTLRTVCGLTSEQVARAFLVSTPTLQQRLVRARQKLDRAGIAYAVPEPAQWAARLSSVLRTVYLVFNEGYVASEGEGLLRGALCEEGIRLGQLLHELLPDEPAVQGVLALMWLHHARAAARTDAAGDLVVLDLQDRSLWDHARIAEALPLVEASLRGRPVSTYAIEAAIAALHAQAPTAEATDWRQIAVLYGELGRRSGGNPVVAVSAAVAVAMAGDLAGGLAQLDALAALPALQGYHWLPAARGDLLRRAGRLPEAAEAYAGALAAARNPVERRYLQGRLAACEADG